MKIAILPGSYDPMTVGHLEIARRASAVYDKIYIAVMINAKKKYMFTMEQRAEIARATVKDISNAEVICDSGMLTDLYRRLGACAVVKGVRDDKDIDYENRMAEYNRSIEPTFNTVYLKSAPEFSDISSTRVRNSILEGENISGLVTDSAIEIIGSLGVDLTKNS